MNKFFILFLFTILLECTPFKFTKVAYSSENERLDIKTDNTKKAVKAPVKDAKTITKDTDNIDKNPVHLERNTTYRDKTIMPDSIKSSRYFGYVNHLVSKKKIDFSKESEALKFYKDTTVRAYGSNSSHFRWHFTRTEKEFTNLLSNNLKEYSKDVYTKVGNNWVKAPIKSNPIGTLKNIKIVERGQTGMAISLYIQGSNGEYIYQNKYNIKKFLGGGAYTLYSGRSGKVLSTNKKVLPTSFIAFEKIGTNYKFYGGGFGHGVGMSQSGAQDMDKNFSKKYKEILKFYYPNANLGKIENKTLKVAITDKNSSLDHKTASFSARGGLELKFNDKTYKVAPGRKGVVKAEGGSIAIYDNDKLLAKGKGTVHIKPQAGLLGITSIRKNHKETNHPYYPGKMEVKIGANGVLNILNEVHIEDYLERVLPSEMNGVGGIESLKAQAITARTYALKTANGTNIAKRGFHLSDTPRYQVYNGKDRNELATKAVKETAGQVLMVNGKYADTQYYSTTSGFGIISDQQ